MSSYDDKRKLSMKNVKEAADLAFKNQSKENIEALFETLNSSGVSLQTAGVSKRKQPILSSKLKPLWGAHKKQSNSEKKREKKGRRRFVPENKLVHQNRKGDKRALHLVHSR